MKEVVQRMERFEEELAVRAGRKRIDELSAAVAEVHEPLSSARVAGQGHLRKVASLRPQP